MTSLLNSENPTPKDIALAVDDFMNDRRSISMLPKGYKRVAAR